MVKTYRITQRTFANGRIEYRGLYNSNNGWTGITGWCGDLSFVKERLADHKETRVVSIEVIEEF